MELHWRSKGRKPQGRFPHKLIRPQVVSPTLAYMIRRIVSVIRCPFITFNSVRRRICMWGAQWG